MPSRKSDISVSGILLTDEDTPMTQDTLAQEAPALTSSEPPTGASALPPATLRQTSLEKRDKEKDRDRDRESKDKDSLTIEVSCLPYKREGGHIGKEKCYGADH